jgi:mitogen-activated protein kinase 7
LTRNPQKFDFGFEEEETIDGMKKLIVDEIAQFRQEVRGQARGDSGTKRQDS